MANYLVETYYTCSIKVSHYLDDISEDTLKNLEKEKEEVRMIDENDILLVSDNEPEQNKKSAGYVNTDGMQQAAVPGNK